MTKGKMKEYVHAEAMREKVCVEIFPSVNLFGRIEVFMIWSF